MKYFLGFDFFYEQTKDGQWTGYGVKEKVKLPEVTVKTLYELEQVFEHQVLLHQCAFDMEASWVYYRKLGIATYVNIPAQKLSMMISLLDVDYSQPGVGIYDAIFDCKKAQCRVKIEPFKHYSLGKILGIYTEPNLLATG